MKKSQPSNQRVRQWHSLIFSATAALVLGLSLTGCATSQEMRMHVAAANVGADGSPTVKFYRITIKASSTNEKSKLETGYYDAAALRALCGQVSREPATGVDHTIGSTLFRYNDKTNTWQNLPANELFAVVYGVHADSLSTAVKTYADSAEVGEAMGRLLARAAGDEQSDDAVQAEQDQADAAKNTNALAAQMKDTAKDLKAAVESDAGDERTPEKIDASLLRLAQGALVQLGSSTKLEPDDPAASYVRLKEAYTVLRENQSK